MPKYAKFALLDTLGKRLNLVAERQSLLGQDRAGVWRDLMTRALEIMRAQNGYRNAYPVAAIGLDRHDPQVVDFNRRMALASDRAVWAATNMAAAEILRRSGGDRE